MLEKYYKILQPQEARLPKIRFWRFGDYDLPNFAKCMSDLLKHFHYQKLAIQQIILSSMILPARQALSHTRTKTRPDNLAPKLNS